VVRTLAGAFVRSVVSFCRTGLRLFGAGQGQALTKMAQRRNLMNHISDFAATKAACQTPTALSCGRGHVRSHGHGRSQVCAVANERDETLLLVDFKWLMAGIGWWVDIARWRADPGYALRCLSNAMASDNPCLHLRAREIVARGLA
jgi:hypothetical protein